jgi:nucleotide-binding universal stress UspA family protein
VNPQVYSYRQAHQVMEPFARILLVYDSSPEARSALTRCVHLAAALSATVDVVSVVDSENLNALSGGQLSGEAFTQLQRLAREAVDDATSRLERYGIKAHGHVAFGRTLDALPMHANMLRSDMVMIGHRACERGFRWWGERPIHASLAERLKGVTIVTVTSQEG